MIIRLTLITATCIAVMAILGCDRVPSDDHFERVPPTHEWNEFSVTYQLIPDVGRVRDLCAKLTHRDAPGCAFWVNGARQGRIVIPTPESLSQTDWEQVAGHELEHIARGEWHR